MSKQRIGLLCVVVIAITIGTLSIVAFSFPQQSSGGAASSIILAGTIKSAAGQALEGVVISAKEEGKTITTSVFTDEEGRYYFTPLAKGHYQVWAQAVGSETAHSAVDLNKETQKDFTLKTIKDFTKQLSGPEWMMALPEDTFEHRRMKAIFRNNCAGCHQPNFVLQNRFDANGWRNIINVMERIGIYGDPPRLDQAPMPLIRAFKEELVKYLTEMRGPGPSPMKFNLLPRPRGEAARVVITEYDVTSNSNPEEYVAQNGSDWSEGPASAYQSRGPHDAEVDANGFVWIVDSQDNPVRTISRLDPKTGAIKDFKLDGRGARKGIAMRSHGIVIDNKGIAWFNADGGLGKMDTKTEKLDWFNPPPTMARAGGTLDVDAQGNVCVSTNEGAIRFDPTTNKFQEFKSVTPGNEGRTYGVAVDSEGNCWWAQMNYDIMGKSDIKTGKSLEVKFSRRPGLVELATNQDRELYAIAHADWNSSPVWQQGPRRLGADKKGQNVYVANWWGDNLARIDIKTNEVKYYQHPNTEGFSGVYDSVVDKNGKVWVNLMNADRVARFDPKTETWTDFMLPSLGNETRFIAVDNNKPTVEVWTPYWRTNRIARLQFRTDEEVRATKAKLQAQR